MASDEILRRIEAHMARANGRMARGNELMARNSEPTEEIRHEHELDRLAFAENARVMARLAEVLDRIDASHTKLIARIDDQGEAIRAQTQAILRLLDRFGGGGADPAAA